MKFHSIDKNYTDPVCGMRVSRISAAAEAEHQGKTYYFCAPLCRDAFLADPERYLRPHRQHGMPARQSLEEPSDEQA